ncbi:unnamed protein product, partial [marine sediment metagenome]
IVAVLLVVHQYAPYADRYEWLRRVGMALLGGAVGILGGRSARKVQRPLRGALLRVTLLGVVLVGSGVTVGVTRRLYFALARLFTNYWAPGGFWPQPSWVNPASVALGSLLLIAGAVGLFVLRRKQKRQATEQ